MRDLRLRWTGALDATSATTYTIMSDRTTSGVFADLEATQKATDRGDGTYSPYVTTLAAPLDDSETTIQLASATNFPAGAYASVEHEMTILGTLASTTYSNSVRGAGVAVGAAHDAGVDVYLAHESVDLIDFDFGGRKAIRFRIQAESSGLTSIPDECIAFDPTEPPTDDLCTVYGVVHDSQGVPVAGATATLTISPDEVPLYRMQTGEMMDTQVRQAISDADGYFELLAPRRPEQSSTATRQLSIDAGNAVWAIAGLPAESTVNFLET